MATIAISKAAMSILVVFYDHKGRVVKEMAGFGSVDARISTIADLCVLRPGEAITVSPLIAVHGARPGVYWAKAEWVPQVAFTGTIGKELQKAGISQLRGPVFSSRAQRIRVTQ